MQVNDIINLLNFIYQNNYRFNKVYHQIFGAQMGLALLTVLEEFVLHVETSTFQKAQYKADLCIRYVDDVLILWRHSIKELAKFCSMLSSIMESMQFTIELEKNKAIAFLDLNIRRTNEEFQHEIYRKPTCIPNVILNKFNHSK